MDMADKLLKRYIFASDFDKTLTFNDSGYVLAELVGIPTEEFERKAKGMAKINLVQQGAELAYLLLHDPEFKAKVRKEHLREVGKRIRLKSDIKLLYQLLDAGIDGHQFDFYVLSAAPVEIVVSALEDIVPPDHIYGTEFRYKPSGEIDTIVRATAGYGKVAVLNRLLEPYFIDFAEEVGALDERAQLRKLVQSYLLFVRDNAPSVRFFLGQLLHGEKVPEELATQVMKLYDGYRELMIDIVRRAQDKNLCSRDLAPEAAAGFMVSALNGSLISFLFTGGGTADELGRAVTMLEEWLFRDPAQRSTEGGKAVA